MLKVAEGTTTFREKRLTALFDDQGPPKLDQQGWDLSLALFSSFLAPFEARPMSPQIEPWLTCLVLIRLSKPDLPSGTTRSISFFKSFLT